jgi:hypothetical protein
MAVSKTTTRKTSTTTELVLGQAAQNITKAIAELKVATDSVSKLSVLGESLTLLVANKEASIEALDVEYGEKARRLGVELDLSFKANTEYVVNEFLRTTGNVSISVNELSNLKKELSDVKANAESVTKTQVAQVANTLKAQYENEIRFLQSENKAVAAENSAKIETLEDKNKFLEQQVSKLYVQLDAERAASIERAKAGSVGSINVGDTSRK